mgnify:CR=1 FL=1
MAARRPKSIQNIVVECMFDGNFRYSMDEITDGDQGRFAEEVLHTNMVRALLHHQLGDGPDSLPLLVGLHAVQVAVELGAVHYRDAGVQSGNFS